MRRKIVGLLMIIILLFVACGKKDYQTKANNDIDDKILPITTSDIDELIGIDYDFQLNDMSSKLIAQVIVNENDEFPVQKIIINDSIKKNVIQLIELSNNEIFTKEYIYFIDLNFDGYLDIIIPKARTASAGYFMAYVYNLDSEKFVYAKHFEDIPNFILDYKNKCILSYRTASQVTSYGMHFYNNTTRDFITTNTLSWFPVGDHSYMQLTEEKVDENNDYVVVRDMIVEAMDYITIDKKADNVSDYFRDGSFWDLNSEKWNQIFWIVDGK